MISVIRYINQCQKGQSVNPLTGKTSEAMAMSNGFSLVPDLIFSYKGKQIWNSYKYFTD